MDWNNSAHGTFDNNSGISKDRNTYKDVNSLSINESTENVINNFKVLNPSYQKKEMEQVKNDKDKKTDFPTVSVFDVAKYILEQLGQPCSTMKLQKLVYYCQVWFLVWEDKPLFNEKIEAWANGPVVRTLFNFHRGFYTIDKNRLTLGDSAKLSRLQKDDIDSVLKFYGDQTSQWLINQTHSEQPWIEARKGLAPFERGDREITPAMMVEYYASLK